MKRILSLILGAALCLSLAACSDWLVDIEESPSPAATDTATPSPSETPPETTPETPTPEPTPEAPVDTPPPRAEATGKSDKEVDKLLTIKATTVRNDTTGNYRYSGFSEMGIDFVDYAVSYYNDYFKADNEVHAVINFANNTTTSINCMAGVLFVTVHERVDGEEHDAALMFSGMPLVEYMVYLDNGDIEEIK